MSCLLPDTYVTNDTSLIYRGCTAPTFSSLYKIWAAVLKDSLTSVQQCCCQCYDCYGLTSAKQALRKGCRDLRRCGAIQVFCTAIK